MATQGKRKRVRDCDQDQRITKKPKIINNVWNKLPDELLMQILAKVPKKNLGVISIISQKWLQITRTRDFWKLSCQQKWPNTVASDTLNFDMEQYLIPTALVQGKIMIDWKFYYNLRSKFSKVTRHVIPVASTETAAAIRAKIIGTELHHSTVNDCVALFSHLSLNKISDEEAIISFDFLCDLALLWHQRNCAREETRYYRLGAIIAILGRLDVAQRPANLRRFFKQIFELCQLIRDKMPDLVSELFGIAIALSKEINVLDDRLKELVKSFIHFTINMGSLPLDQKKIGNDMIFQYPIASKGNLTQLILGHRVSQIELVDMVFNIACDTYYNSTDWKIKVSAICVGLVMGCKNKDYVNKYCRLAIHAAKQTDFNVAFTGLLGLCQITQSKSAVKCLDDKQWKKIFLLLCPAILMEFSSADRVHSVNVIRMSMYDASLRLFVVKKSDLISQPELDVYMTNVMRMFREKSSFSLIDAERVYKFYQLGAIFKNRLTDTLESIKLTMFHLAQHSNTKGLEIERLLECYVKFGVLVKGSKFASDFKKLVWYIENDKSRFTVSIMKCYERFAFEWSKFATVYERQLMINAMLKQIPAEVFEFGQSRISSNLTYVNDVVNEDLPETWQELMREREDLVKLDIIGKLDRAPIYMTKEQLKPVNPLGETFPPPALSSFNIKSDVVNYTTQLFNIITYPKYLGCFISHAQDVFHAMLARLRARSFSIVDYYAVIDLFSCVKEEMGSADLIQYVDIILHCLASRSGPGFRTEEKYERLSTLYRYCLSILNEIPDLANVTIIINAIDICYNLSDYSITRLAELSELMYHFITSWPRCTHEAIKHSKLGMWLIGHITDANKTSETLYPYLMVFAIVAGLFGIEYVLEALCTHPTAHGYHSPESYLALVVPHCQLLYKQVRRGTVKIVPLHHNYLRKFLILNAIYNVDRYAGGIGAIPQQSRDNIERLQDAIASERFDTGVPKLNKLVKSMDLHGICKELFLHQTDEEEEYETSDEEQEEDMFIRAR